MTVTKHPFLAACRREPTSYTPVWLMRQAGRYMEEYRKLRAQHDFLELCKQPDLAAEITVTPVERLGVDAAILFADILLILEPLGVGLEYSKGDGPVIHRPVRSARDVDSLRSFDPGRELSFVYEAVKKIRTALNDKVPVAKPSCANPVEKNMALGQRLGVSATPTLIFANGERVSGMLQLGDLNEQLEKTPKR